MTHSKTTLAILIGVFLIGLSSVVAFAKSDKEESQEVAASECKLEKYIDPVVFAETMASANVVIVGCSIKPIECVSFMSWSIKSN